MADSRVLAALAGGGIAAMGYFMTQSSDSRLVYAKSGSVPAQMSEKKQLQRRPSWEAKFDAPPSKDSAREEFKAVMDEGSKDRLKRRPSYVLVPLTYHSSSPMPTPALMRSTGLLYLA